MLFNLWAKVSYFLKDFSLYLVIITLSLSAFVYISLKIVKSKKSKKQKKIQIALVYCALLIILTFCIFEAYFRYIYDESDGLGFLKVSNRWHQRHNVHNNYFFRDRNFETEKEQGVVRIGVLGDSIAQGNGIKDPEDRFSNILEQKLKNAGKNAEVYNLGKSGYDTIGEIKEYEKVKHLKFDILVWEYFINDVQPEHSTGMPIIDENSKTGSIAKFISSKSFFFDYIYWRFSSKYNKTILQLRDADLKQYHNPEVILEHKKRIAEFIKELEKEKITTVVVFFPSISLLADKYLAEEEHYMMVDYFKQQEVDATVDLLPELIGKDKKQLVASRFDTHPNEIVHMIAAQKLYEAILPLLDKPTSSQLPQKKQQLPTGRR